MIPTKNTAMAGNQNTNVDEMMQQTEMGSFLSKNKGSAIGLVILILLAVFGGGFYTSMKSKSDDKTLVKIFQFETTALKALEEEKLKPAEFVEKFNMANIEFGSFDGRISLLLASSKALLKLDKPRLAQSILKTGMNIKEAYSQYILSLHMASLHEDLKEYPEAIVILEKLTSSKVKASIDKVYLDLGRLYKLSGNTEKAKVNFTYIIENLQDKEMRKLAKIYRGLL